MSNENGTPETVVVVTPPPPETPDAEVATAAEATVLAAQTAVALAEGQAAIATQQAAAVATEAAEDAAEAVAVVRSAEEQMQWLMTQVAEQGEALRSCQTTISEFSTLLQSRLPAEAPTTVELTQVEPDGTTTDLTLQSTSPEQVATLTEAIAESEASEQPQDSQGAENEPAQEGRARRHRVWI